MEDGVDKTPVAETNKFDSKAREIISRLGVEKTIPDVDKTLQVVREKIEGYKLPEAFFDDDVNVAILVGCGQKLTESTDPIYKRRVDNLIRRLVAPSAAEGTLDTGELWGTQSERGGLGGDERTAYINSKVSEEATRNFEAKYNDQITKAKDIWKSQGYDLTIRTKIVADNIADFKQKTNSAGFVNVPERDTLSPGNPVEIEFVLLKGYSDKDNFVRHELYHVEDYWNFIRRGFQEGVLESLDELHTEYAAGNYKEDHSKEPFGDASYFTLKQFWDKLSFAGNVDFNVLSDRRKAIETVAKNFGFGGLVDFTLMHAHSSGKATIFETFYRDHERPIMGMLVSREEINLKEAENNGSLQNVVVEAISSLSDLQKYLTPPQDSDWLTKYKSIYNLIPTKEGHVWSASPLENGNLQLPNGEAKRVVDGYTRALAFAELYYRGGLKGQESLYNSVVSALDKVSPHRNKMSFSPNEYVKDQFDRSREFYSSDEEAYKEVYSSLFNDLVSDMPGVDFAFNLQNPTTRGQILQPFVKELDVLAQHCISTGNPNFMKSFAEGLHRFNMTVELREMAAKYLKDNYPELKGFVEARQATFDSRKISNFSF